MAEVSVTVYLPTLLAPAAGGRGEVEVRAQSLKDCLAHLIRDYPLLEVHLYDEEGELREHVNLFYNDQNLRWLDDWEVQLRAGDTLTVLQAVSGG